MIHRNKTNRTKTESIWPCGLSIHDRLEDSKVNGKEIHRSWHESFWKERYLENIGCS